MNDQLLRCKGILTRLSLIFILFLLSFSGWAQTGEPIVEVYNLANERQDDFAPGEFVIFKGSGFGERETISLSFLETPTPESCLKSHDIILTTKADGSFSNFDENFNYDPNGEIPNTQFLVKPNHLGVKFDLTVTGQSSGKVATAVFTDADNTTLTLAVSSVNFSSGTSITFTAKLSTTSGGISGRSIDFWFFNTNQASATTDSNGNAVATIVVSGSSGVYTGNDRFKAEWIGDNFYKKSTSSQIGFTITSCTPPAGLSYTNSSPVYCNGTAISTNTATLTTTGTPAPTFTVSPSLPAGLLINGSTGAITGTPTVNAAAANYTVTAINNCGTATSVINITVKAPPTTAVAGPPQTVCPGSSATLAANNPTVGTGAWSVLSGPSTNLSQFNSTLNPAATFIPTGGNGAYTLRWTISNSPCTASFSDVVITVEDNEAPVLTGIMPVGGTGINACSAPSGPTIGEIASLYEDACGGAITVVKSGAPLNGCNWSVTYFYHITDQYGNAVAVDPTVSYSGSDQTAPALVDSNTTAESSFGESGVDACLSAAVGFDATAHESGIAALYDDGCSTVSAVLFGTEPGANNSDCSWSFVYTYTISDGCPGNDFTTTVTRSGSDQTAPALVDSNTTAESSFGESGVDACLSDAQAFDATAHESGIAALYDDGCSSTVTATLTGTQPDANNTDCSWSFVYTYTISDGCPGNDFTTTVTRSGSDQTAPALVDSNTTAESSFGESGVDACLSAAVGFDATAHESGIAALYDDGCSSTVTATLTGTQPDANNTDCSWSFVYTYTISDGCSGNDFTTTVIRSGSDQTAPALVDSNTTAESSFGESGVDACLSDAQAFDATAHESGIAALYDDGCSSTVTATLTGTQPDANNTDCSWSFVYTYTISDGCPGNDFTTTVTRSGSDQTAPALVDSNTTAESSFGESGVDACLSAAVGFDATAHESGIAALYDDGCSSTVTATLTGTQPDANNTDCSWSFVYTYTISDGCSGNDFTTTVIRSGSDQTAPALVDSNTTAESSFGESGVDACLSDAQAFDATAHESGIAALYDDGCSSTVTATLTGTQPDANNTDCSWSFVYTYTISDGCPGNDFTTTVTRSGSDQTAPVLVDSNTTAESSFGESGVDACLSDAQAFDATAHESGIAALYDDGCSSTVTATLTGTQPDANNTDCSWSFVYTYTISDGCSGNDFTTTVIRSGSDQTAPALVDSNTTAESSFGESGVDACLSAAVGFDATAHESGIAALYDDGCSSTVTATLTGTQPDANNTDCSWSFVYTYTISDGCSGNDFTTTVIRSGSDQTAPALVDSNTTAESSFGESGVDACLSDAVGFDATAHESGIAALYDDGCSSTVTATLTGTQPDANNTDCSWSFVYTYTISDGCPGNDFTTTVTRSGSDQTAPVLVDSNTTAESSFGESGVDACLSDAQAFDATAHESGIAALYDDGCSSTVTATLTGTQPDANNTDCSWSFVYTYTISDGCSGNDFTTTVIRSGSDQTAPALVDSNTTAESSFGESGVDACLSDAQAFDATAHESGIAALYDDGCSSTVTATLTGTQPDANNTDCSWSFVYTYTISDGCSGNDFTTTVIRSGSDQTAPALVDSNTTAESSFGESGVDACLSAAVGFDATAHESGIAALYDDGCSSTVTATLTGTQPDANNTDCSWSFVYTYTISDGCPGNDFTTTVTRSGSDQTAPVIGDITVPSGPVQIGTDFNLTATYTDCSIVTAIWHFSSDGVTYEYSKAGDVDGNNIVFNNTVPKIPAGVYNIKLEISDACGNTLISDPHSEFLVIYDPSGGFVTGGGWIISPMNPAYQYMQVEGRANFGFNAKYKTGKNNTTEVDGNTNFQFKDGDLHFKSSSHTAMSLIISGERKATYKGSGTVNGSGSYGFMVTVIDGEAPGAGQGDVDSFRIKIWNAGGVVVYDNNIPGNQTENADPSTAISGGSIVIHKPKGNSKAQEDLVKGTPIIMEDLKPEILETLAASPNPVVSYSTVRFSVKEDAIATLRLYDNSGRLVETLFTGAVKAFENYDVDLQRRNLMSGIYIVKLTTAKGHSYDKRIIIN